MANHIEKLQQDLLWGVWVKSSNFIWFCKVCTSISEGGLGVQNLLVFNLNSFGEVTLVLCSRGLLEGWCCSNEVYGSYGIGALEKYWEGLGGAF